jgi:arsenate reductase
MCEIPPRARPAAALLRAMADTPKLIERPVVFAGGRAVIARPPELVEELA